MLPAKSKLFPIVNKTFCDIPRSMLNYIGTLNFGYAGEKIGRMLVVLHIFWLIDES